MSTDVDVLPRLELAKATAREAGRATLDFFQQANYDVERKGDNSPVTVADRRAESIMRSRIEVEFPDDAVLGEELGEKPGSSGYRWILDPIDGTKSFISGVPLYGTLVGIEHETRAVAGVIYMPGLDEGIYASRGQGAWFFRGETAASAARVSTRQALADGTFVTSQVDGFDQRRRKEAYQRLQQASYITRTWGDCYGYLLVATGRVEVMVDPIMNVWDAAALQPIMEEAGGTFTDWQGNPTIHNEEGVATNGLVLDEVLAITRDFPKPA